jgi:ketosteroid isomerase-like protein
MSSNAEQEILILEEEHRQAVIRLDVAAIDRLYADDLMVTSPIGTMCDKAGTMAEARAGASKSTVEAYDKDNMHVRVFGETAATSYRLTIKAEHDGQEINRQYQITNVWLKRQGRWQIAACHTASLDQENQQNYAGAGNK